MAEWKNVDVKYNVETLQRNEDKSVRNEKILEDAASGKSSNPSPSDVLDGNKCQQYLLYNC